MTHLIRSCSIDDVDAALRLCRLAGWNQLRADWVRMINYQPDGCFVAVSEDQVIGTVTTTSYGTELAWIGMMLVDPDHRRRGIATELMRASIEYLVAQKIRCIKLDATPEGKPVYERLGFQTEWQYHRWQGTVETDASDPPGDPNCKTFAMDHAAFGVDRASWLKSLAEDSEVFWHEDGFGMTRPGARATYLGPVTAATPEAAREIVSRLLVGVRGEVFWDLPQANVSAVSMAESFGFVPVRDLYRMRLGEPDTPDLERIYAFADPGTG